jgi:glycopeptide antibiotics resistance protein
VGLGIEASQLAISLLLGVCYRSVDINDVLLNACGVLVGYMLYCICAWIYSTASRVGEEKKIKTT